MEEKGRASRRRRKTTRRTCDKTPCASACSESETRVHERGVRWLPLHPAGIRNGPPHRRTAAVTPAEEEDDDVRVGVASGSKLGLLLVRRPLRF